jgi:hypothetical protein
MHWAKASIAVRASPELADGFALEAAPEPAAGPSVATPLRAAAPPHAVTSDAAIRQAVMDVRAFTAMCCKSQFMSSSSLIPPIRRIHVEIVRR